MKKVVSLLLVLLLSLGMVTIASANWGVLVGGQNTTPSELWDNAEYTFQHDNIDILVRQAPSNIDLSTATPGITEVDFGGGVIGYQVAPNVNVSRFFRVDRVNVSKGSQYIDGSPKLDLLTVEGVPRVAVIRLDVKDKVRTLNTHDILLKSYRVQFMQDNNRWSGSVEYSLDNEAKWANAYYEVEKDDVYASHAADGSKGHMLEARAYINNIEVEIGEEVYFKTRLFQNRRYWAWADMDWWEKDDAMKKQYPSIQEVVNVEWLGYNDSTTTVNFKDFATDNYWVYAADSEGNLKYVGRSNAWLDLVPETDGGTVAKYYLSSREIDVDSDIEPEDDIDDEYDDVPEINPITGGDDVYPSNVNDNPGTGK